MTYPAIIRQRGQLTIPDNIRTTVDWLKTGRIVMLEIGHEEIKIKPHAKISSTKIDWNDMWRKIELARSFKGEKGNLSAFIAKDRHSH